MVSAVQEVPDRGEWSGELPSAPSRERKSSGQPLDAVRDERTSPRAFSSSTPISRKSRAERKILQQAALLDKAQDAIFVQERLEPSPTGTKRRTALRVDCRGDTELRLFDFDEAGRRKPAGRVREGEWTGEPGKEQGGG
jgi:hypothetical protein